ncbi:MAG: adenylate/guanylate cyclase domain-containing protein [Bacteroidales bacterium]
MHKKVKPGYHIVRIYVISILFYIVLLLPVLIALSYQMGPKLIETRDSVLKAILWVFKADEIKNDTIAGFENQIIKNESITEKDKTTDNQIIISQNKGRREGLAEIGRKLKQNYKTPYFTAISIIVLVVFLFTSFLALIINLPLKRFFRKLRKNKAISPQLCKYCKPFLLRSPFINAGILFLSFTILHGYIYFVLRSGKGFEDIVCYNLFINFFYVSVVASLMAVLFVYLWQKHRVRNIYLEYVFDAGELYKMNKYFRKSRIHRRFWFLIGLTVLISLTLIIVYVLLGLTSIKSFGNLSAEQLKILTGYYFENISDNDYLTKENISSLYYINAFDNILMISGIVITIIVMVIFLFIQIKWATLSIIAPVKELAYNMQWIEGEGTDNFTIIRVYDEIGQLCEQYNEMTIRLKAHTENITEMNTRLVRFVPKQFFKLLGKEIFTEIKPGDQIQRDMTMLVADINSFIDGSEEINSSEGIELLNQYLSLAEPLIQENNGIIDRHSNGSVIALFSRSVDDAIEAAVAIQQSVRQFNDNRKGSDEKEINIGLGIHTGSLILGIIGNENRMEDTIIGKAVDFAMNLANLTKTYGSTLLISEDALIKLGNTVHFRYRIIDMVSTNEKSELIYIFEILNGEEEKLRKHKEETRDLFGKAVELYHSDKLDESLDIFHKILTINPEDKAAKFYYDRCSSADNG